VSQLLDIEWPLTHLDLPGYRLNAALTDKRSFRFRILLVLLGSGHGIGKRFWATVDATARRRLHSKAATSSRPVTE
ncbi:MAG TPA: hypothetical protein VGF87_02565, partial [Acidimicrobiales bacterium]